MPLGQRVARVGRERRQGKAQEGLDIQRAGFVVGIELVVLALVFGRVHHAATDEETPPLVVAVGGDEGVIEVEEGQIHGARFYPKRLINNW